MELPAVRAFADSSRVLSDPFVSIRSSPFYNTEPYHCKIPLLKGRQRLACRSSHNSCIVANLNFNFDPQSLVEYRQYVSNVLQMSAQTAAKLLPVRLLFPDGKIQPELSAATVAAAVGSFAGLLTTAIPSLKLGQNIEGLDRDWLLFMDPTPFNRFVMMRCPSVVFEKMDAFERFAKELTSERCHFVKLIKNKEACVDYRKAVNNRAKLPRKKKYSKIEDMVSRTDSGRSRSGSSFNKQVGEPQKSSRDSVMYQRRFLHTEDGGVLAIDWPTHLDLSGDHGLDTTVILVAGTVAGSRDKNVKHFVNKFLRQGYFPIVLNPRGCGGSPLLTPRLFSAGDSTDIRAAVKFVVKSRPWSTVMTIGWGYGANMLSKYLGEEAAGTPITAAVCINNPFDLQDSVQHSTESQEMTNLLVEILKSNQMVFEGRQFDIQKGLSARSIREFDNAISRVSAGFANVEDFYQESSSGQWINQIKIPILFVHDSNTVETSSSLVQHVFEENPYTTFIFSLGQSKQIKALTMDEISEFDPLILEWFAAVELAFLKGRHPLLQGLDLTFQPPKEWALFAKQLESSGNQGSLLNGEMSVNGSESPSYTYKHKGRDDPYQNNGYMLSNKDEISDSVDPESEQGQLQQAAESVIKALDATMPGTLSPKKKEEVLEAIGRGETIVAALQEACPEDVREKMVTAVSTAVQANGISLKLAGFGKNIPAPVVSESVKRDGTTSAPVCGIQKENPDSSTPCGKPTSQDSPSSSSVQMDIQEPQRSTDQRQDESREGDVPQGSSSENVNEGTLNTPADDGITTNSESESVHLEQKPSQHTEEEAKDTGSQSEKTFDSSENGNKRTGAPSTDTTIVQNPIPPPASLGLSRALAALTDVDDSTQLAVNNVFEVIENVIDQLGKEKDHKDEQVETETLDMQRQDVAKDQVQTQEHSVNQSPLVIENVGTYEQGIDVDMIGNRALKFNLGFNNYVEKRIAEGIIRNLKWQMLTDVDYSILATKQFPSMVAQDNNSTSPRNKMSSTSNDVSLEYFEDENIWMLLCSNMDDDGMSVSPNKKSTEKEIEPDNAEVLNDQIIEPEYVILDNSMEDSDSDTELSSDRHIQQTKIDDTSLPDRVLETVVKALKLELVRRLGDSTFKTFGVALDKDIMKVGFAVSATVNLHLVDTETCETVSNETDLLHVVHANIIITAIKNIYGECVVLPRIIPIGMIFGIVLASLSSLEVVRSVKPVKNKKTMHPHVKEPRRLATLSNPEVAKTVKDMKNKKNMHSDVEEPKSTPGYQHGVNVEEIKHSELQSKEVPSQKESVKNASKKNQITDTVAVAMGAAAALAAQQHVSEQTIQAKESDDSKNESNDTKTSIVSTLAEKAMSVAAPVVPTKEDGAVDHDRLVEVLAALGQKGGFWRYIGKVALLWSGLRGAISLTDKLLVFLHMSERPLHQRLSSFMIMALLLWSPVLVPLLPTLLQQWASHSYTGVTSTAACVGWYGAVVILVTIWGRKIRGYEDPLSQYGVKIAQPIIAKQIRSVFTGLCLGSCLIGAVYLIGISCGTIQFFWDTSLSFGTKGFVSNIASGVRMFKLVLHCCGISIAVSFVEELLFRSWLQEEISADLGFHRAAVLSGLAFALSQRSLKSIPGLWLLSLFLTCVKIKCNGNLSLAIGIHAGVIAAKKISTHGGQIKFLVNAPTWLMGMDTRDPLSGFIGMSVVGLLTLLFYPWDDETVKQGKFSDAM